MAATEQDHRHPRRRFVTRYDVEDAARAGRALQLEPRDVITHEAAQRARDLGVEIVRGGASGGGASGGAGGAGRAAPTPGKAPADAGGDTSLRRAVRAAVVAELGSEPPNLDAAIDKVLAARGRA